MFRGKKNLANNDVPEGQPKRFLESFKRSWIRGLKKKMSSNIHPQVQQQP
ncbi:1707_t:CDS:2 [Diversispora eburnea]|uniref:1707_t:CDS:1 n=1 Tax=Diversispora eburnea TaxID=1213867 RepID=A0A9N9FYE0_9GLOM|nr:1707_t:CDS:2 [Diversispora eburnea]